MTGEERNPFGGFLFSGPDDALSRLAEAAESCGLKLVAVEAGDGVIRMCLPAEQSFGAAGVDLVNRAQAGEFGNVSLGLFGGTVQPPHLNVSFPPITDISLCVTLPVWGQS